MRLLLTSAGLKNRTIINALTQLTSAPFESLKLAYIPTAANVEAGSKDWVVNDINQAFALSFAQFDIVDFSAVPKDVWLPRLEEADILMFGGGNTFHLMHALEQSGLKELLPSLLEKRAYIGVSAGSCVTTKNISLSQDERLYSETIGELDKDEGLGLVDFHVRPHFNSPYFPKITKEYVGELSKELSEPVYLIDDETAIVVNDEKVEVVSEGKWEKFN